MPISISRIITVLILLLNFVVVPAFAEQKPSIEPSNEGPAPVDVLTMTRVGKMSTGGVLATAYISKLASVDSRKTTHRVVVTFVNEKSTVALAKGLVGIKHRKLFGETSEPVWMKSSNKQPELFVADVSLKRRGTYLFIVGSKLEDDKKRQFTFQYRH